MNFTVLTIFPEMFDSFWNHGVVGKASESGIISTTALDIREYAEGRHRVTDDRPFGGGAGMVFKPEPLAKAIRAAKASHPEAKTVLTTPQGRVFDQKTAVALSAEQSLIIVCGRYEGIDERITANLIDDEISIGDYILTGGELAAMAIIDAVARLIPGTLGCGDSAERDSFSDGLLEHEHYTRPRDFEGETVPDVLLSGHHAEIEKWRMESSMIRTFLKRRDLIENRELSERELEILRRWRLDIDEIIHIQSRRKSETNE